MTTRPQPLVDTGWLARHLDNPDLVIVDVRWEVRFEDGRGVGYDDYDGYLAGHIPGAVFARMEGDLSDPHHPVPNMMVPPEAFAAAMSRLGIGDDTLVVAYDNTGVPRGAARLWWALNYYGHDHVRVLDGGLRQWRLDGRPLSTDVPAVEPRVFTPRPQAAWLATKADVKAALDDRGTLIIDCLTPDQYRGDAGTHHWGRRSGHIAGAINIPAAANLDPQMADLAPDALARRLAELPSFRLAPAETLSTLYRSQGATPDRPIITYCGRGFAAACGLLALKSLGYDDVRLYDGSWAEWGGDPELPVETGEAKGEP